MKHFFRLIPITVVFCIIALSANAQLTVVPNHTATVLATKLAGPGITVTSPVLTCAAAANGTFTAVATPIVIDSGIILTSGRSINTTGTEAFLASFNNGTPGDPALAALAGTTTFDACILEFDFVPKGDTVSFNYQFGSEEYINSTCGQYNDAFAFFISGPGITGTQNMALVPGTNIPVTVNTINSGVPGPPGWPGFCNIANCTSMGPGSPFTTYFVNNTGGTLVTYRGYTQKLTAFHRVTPCSTYHLKMTVADAANSLYDSGVFIEAGSLKTNSYMFKRSDSIGHTIAGIPNAFVKGCTPAPITVLNSRATGTPQKVYFTYGGTAIQGVDFTGPDSATIAPGDTSVIISLAGIPTTPGGIKTLFIYLSSPFSCGTIDTLALNILDGPLADIVTPDTSICLGSSFQIRVAGSMGLFYSWTPAGSLSSVTAMEPIAAPLVNTTYTMTATLPLSGCPPIIKDVSVVVNTASLIVITPDTTVCIGENVQLQVSGTAGLSYSWTPGSTLSNPNIQNPVASPMVTTIYTVSGVSATGGCPAVPQQVTITVVNPVINILTPNTSVCLGVPLNILVNGDPGYTYSWTPAAGLSDATIKDPIATPNERTTYTVTATVPVLGCTVKASVTISLLPEIIAHSSKGISVCLKQSIELNVDPQGSNYGYQWAGPSGFNSVLASPFIRYAMPANEGVYTVTVTDLTTGCKGSDTSFVKVGNDSLALMDITPDQTIPFGSSIQLNAANAVLYTWTPNDGSLDNPNINNPVATPKTRTTYIVYGVGKNGCLDVDSVTIDVSFEDDIFVPSGFTPNGDGINDVFRVSGHRYFKFVDMSVFNRWGQLVYHSEGGDNSGWDGDFNGMKTDMGTYSYHIIISKAEGVQQSYKGTVTLIR
jgi:gliding motility-associated-like protein